jgi:hypothetical protein
MTAKRYRKKPVEVEAVQYLADGSADAQIRDWAGGISPDEPGIVLAPGEWLLREEDGILSTLKDDTFHATYEPVEEGDYANAHPQLSTEEGEFDRLGEEIDGLERLASDLGGDPKRALLASVARLRALATESGPRCEGCNKEVGPDRGPYPPDGVYLCEDCETPATPEPKEGEQ